VPVLPNGKSRDRPMDDHPFAVHDPLAAVFFRQLAQAATG
jgi:hypothetical protein